VRALIPDLESPHPLGHTLPAIYHEDDLAQRFLSALDDVVAPVFNTIDCFPAYLDPRTTPPDFLPWLASWIGLALDERWPVERKRRMIERAGDLFSRRGTAGGLRELIGVFTGAEVEVEETGECTWSASPGAEPPGSSPPRVTVRVRTTADQPVDQQRIERLVADATPAHIIAEVEVLTQ
jgi:phage tail-like protein